MMKIQIMHYLFSILFLVSVEAQAMNVSNREEALKSVNDETQNEILYYAVKNNNIERVQLSIKGGADVNKQDDIGETPLHLAAWKGYLEIVEQLLKCGADVNMQSNYGTTPLHYAVPRGCVEVAQQLIKGGAAGLKMLHKLVGNRLPCLTADKRAKLIKLLVYNKPMLARLKSANGKIALQCAEDLEQHLTNLLQDPKQYIAKHPEEFKFIQDVDYNIQVAKCNLLKRTMPNLVHKIRNRELGMPFNAKLRTNQGLRATANNSSQKEKLEAAS